MPLIVPEIGLLPSLRSSVTLLVYVQRLAILFINDLRSYLIVVLQYLIQLLNRLPIQSMCFHRSSSFIILL